MIKSKTKPGLVEEKKIPHKQRIREIIKKPKENIKKRKEKQRKELKDKYCSDEYRKQKAIEIASRKS